MKRQVKKKHVRALVEGSSQSLNVLRDTRGIRAALPSQVLKYLKAKPGDKLAVVARNGAIEITPMLSISEEIEKYLSI